MIALRCSVCGHFAGCHRVWPDWLCCECLAWALRMVLGGG